MKKLFYNRKLVITIFVVLIVLLTAVAIGPMVYSLLKGAGVKTEPISADGAKAASTELDGTWEVAKGRANNHTSVGFTFNEVLPAEKTTTSGSTTEVTGQADISDSTLKTAAVTVDMDELTTDKKVRDQNMKSKLFEVDEFPVATFTLTEPADLSAVPDDGSAATVSLTGDLTIHGETKQVTNDFQVVRDADTVVLGGDIPLNRLDYGVETPEMIAAKISEVGAVNVRGTLQK